MLAKLRREVVNIIWNFYKKNSYLPYLADTNLYLDHFALITLNIDDIIYIFKRLGFVCAGKDYIESKQNFFIWFREKDYNDLKAKESLPQVVLGYFNIDAMPNEIQNIISKYVDHVISFDYDYFDKLLDTILSGPYNDIVYNEFLFYIGNFLNNINYDNKVVSHDDYSTIKKYNELLSWVLIFGHMVNHFGIALHLDSSFNSFEDFVDYYNKEYSIKIDNIKGNQDMGIIQASHEVNELKIFDRYIVNQFFIEFVWRYPVLNDSSNINKNSYYYNEFIASNASSIVESLLIS